jgi:hypothetical protein
MAQTLRYNHASGNQTCKKKQDSVIYIAQNNIDPEWPCNVAPIRENKLILRPLVRQKKKKINVSMLKP